MLPVAVNSGLFRILGTMPDNHVSPPDTPVSCPLSLSVGVSQMKFGADVVREEMNSLSAWPDGVDGAVVVWKCEHLGDVFMSLNSIHGKWSAFLGGLKLHVPEFPAFSAQAFHVSPADSSLSIMF